MGRAPLRHDHWRGIPVDDEARSIRRSTQSRSRETARYGSSRYRGRRVVIDQVTHAEHRTCIYSPMTRDGTLGQKDSNCLPYRTSHLCRPILTSLTNSCSRRLTREKCIVWPSIFSAPAASAICCSTVLKRRVRPRPSTSAPDTQPSAIRGMDTCAFLSSTMSSTGSVNVWVLPDRGTNEI